MTDRDSPPAPDLVIVSARADVVAGTLTIDGHGFGDVAPSVTLNGTPLDVVTSTPTHIVATLPPSLDPGSYLLTVSRGPATTQFDAFNVTLGAAGPQSPAGSTGPQGPPGTFTGHFQSPNGAYSLDVTDTGIRLAGPGATIQIANGTVTIMATNVVVRSDMNTEIRSGANTTMRSSANTDIQSSAAMMLRAAGNTSIQSSGSTSIDSSTISLNGGGHPAARAGDPVQVDPTSGVGVIVTGSTTVFIGN